MRIYEYAAAHELSSADVSAAAAHLGFEKTGSAAGLTDEQQVLLDQYFESPPDAPGTDAESGDAVPGTPVWPAKIYKYCRRRRVTLADVQAACPSLGISGSHDRHRMLSEAEIALLDAHFFPES